MPLSQSIFLAGARISRWLDSVGGCAADAGGWPGHGRLFPLSRSKREQVPD
jgi:hypothetical protein